MRIKQHNSAILDEYFENLIKEKKEIPFITKASEELKMSVSTISRYAKSKGYMGYPHMRSDLVQQSNGESEKEKHFSPEAIRFIDFLHQNEKIVIYTSASAKPVGNFLYERLKSFKLDVQMLEDFEALSTLCYASIAITVSGESTRIDKFLSYKKKFKNTLMISCNQSSVKNAIVLEQFMYKKRTNINLWKSLRQMNEWIQEVVDGFISS